MLVTEVVEFKDVFDDLKEVLVLLEAGDLVSTSSSMFP